MKILHNILIIMINIEEGTTQTFSYMKLNHINGPLLCTMPILAVSTSLLINFFFMFLLTWFQRCHKYHLFTTHHDLCFKFILGVFSFQTNFCYIFTGFIVFSIVYCRHQQLSTLFHGWLTRMWKMKFMKYLLFYWNIPTLNSYEIDLPVLGIKWITDFLMGNSFKKYKEPCT